MFSFSQSKRVFSAKLNWICSDNIIHGVQGYLIRARFEHTHVFKFIYFIKWIYLIQIERCFLESVCVFEQSRYSKNSIGQTYINIVEKCTSLKEFKGSI